MFPDTPNTLLDELALEGALDESKWQRFDELYRPAVAAFLVQRFPSLAGEVEDFAQETMVRLVSVLREKKYDVARGRFRTFLGAIVYNLAIDALRREDRFASIPLETVDWVCGSQSEVSSLTLIDRQWQEACYAAARRQVLHHTPLPPHYADIWRALEKGASIAESAKRFNVSAALVRQVKHRVSALISAHLATFV